jgi:predicted O-methyltransferase YrrM
MTQLEELILAMPRQTWSAYEAGKPEAYEHLYSVLPAVADVPGLFAEIGTFKGFSARLILTVCPGRKLHCFDTWEGITHSIKGEQTDGAYSTDMSFAQEFLSDFDVTFHKGVFPDTFDLWDEKFAFVHSDTDTYFGTKASLKVFLPRMAKGGIIVVDDVDHPNAPFIRKAIDEFSATWDFDEPSHHGIIRV